MGLSAFRVQDTLLSLCLKSPRPQTSCFTLLREYPSMVASHPVIWSGQPSRICRLLKQISPIPSCLPCLTDTCSTVLSLWRFYFSAFPMVGLGLTSARPSTLVCLPSCCPHFVGGFLFSVLQLIGVYIFKKISSGSFSGVFRGSKISYVCSVVILGPEINRLLFLS